MKILFDKIKKLKKYKYKLLVLYFKLIYLIVNISIRNYKYKLIQIYSIYVL